MHGIRDFKKKYGLPLWLKKLVTLDCKFNVCPSKSSVGTLPEVSKQGLKENQI